MDYTDYEQLIKSSVLDNTFTRITLSGVRRNQDAPWKKIVMRPVQIKGQRHVQFSYFDEHKDITKNYAGDDVARELDKVLTLGFKHTHVLTTSENIQVTLSSKGRPLVSRTKVVDAPAIDLNHNRKKQAYLPEGTPNAFLHAIGIMNAEGGIRPGMYDKYRQINEFLKLVDQTIKAHRFDNFPINIVDFGCGNAYLTFAAYHYLNHVLELPSRLIGVDRKADLIGRNNELARSLGWENIDFHVGSIGDFRAETPVALTFALHACDTATDDALAQAIRLQSQFIFSAPCCQHHLQEQMDAQSSPDAFRSVLRHGILKERLGDVLTDAFRASILRMHGYKTDVIQFVSGEHTAKNIMIRAAKTAHSENVQAAREYEELKQYWNVTPYLESVLEVEVVGNPVTAVTD